MDSILVFWNQMTDNPLLELTKKSTDVLVTISWRDIFNCLEACVDACEHVSECVGTVIMKNT